MPRAVRFIFIFITALLIGSGVRILKDANNIDGDGMGISFLGIKINDSVAITQVPYYAWSMIGLGILLFITITYLNFKLMKKTETK
ncbi:hypothetical protein [Peribacillus alkalitolerans]|uniref:hypothetical protein n=1 Tax=Peribacillus alkalitolerans TaxID=1550385 RepID=UPI0013D4BCDF|nr:hypothetical protein [Peribacillus alkalitolerans]